MKKKSRLTQPVMQEVLAPPKKLLFIKHPKSTWYHENLDRHCHQRTLWLTRGMYLIEEWWQQHNSFIEYPMLSNMEYCLNGIPQLKNYILKFHQAIAKHQNINQFHLVLGVGASQLLQAAAYAIAIYHAIPSTHYGYLRLPPLYITEQLPGYLDLKESIESIAAFNAIWLPPMQARHCLPSDLLEVVTTPNNPDGNIHTPITDANYIVKDRVNHWPWYMTSTPDAFLSDRLDNDWIAVFSLGKILSFSGSRVGYAMVKDPKIAHYMKHFIIRSTHGMASDGQFHCLAALHYLLDHNLIGNYANWLTTIMRQRWQQLTAALSSTNMTLLNEQGPNAWIKTPIKAKPFLMKKYHILATYGPEYGAGEDYARINLLCSSAEFNEFLYRIRQPTIITHNFSA